MARSNKMKFVHYDNSDKKKPEPWWEVVVTEKQVKDVYRTQVVTVYDYHVSVVRSILHDLNKTESKITASVIWTKLIHHYKLDIETNEFTKGRNRRDYLLLYYYPIKILEHLKIIEYTGHGIISLLEE